MSEQITGVPNPGGSDELSPELEEERREIEVRIDLHVAKIYQIANLFGWKAADLSPSLDEEIERDDNKKTALIESVLGEQRRVSKTTFDIGEARIDISDYPRLYTSYQAAAIREVGKITALGHDNYLGYGIRDARSLIFTPGEQEKVEAVNSYFGPPVGDDILSEHELEMSLDARSAMVSLRERAREDPDIKDFVAYCDEEGFIPQGVYDFGNFFPAYVQTKGEEQANRVRSAAEDIIFPKTMHDGYKFSYGSSKLSEAVALAARLRVRIAQIYNERAGYLLDTAKNGDSRFQKIENEGKKIYKVKDDFQFTEEDAKKAAEMNLPWSRLEKETNE